MQDKPKRTSINEQWEPVDDDERKLPILEVRHFDMPAFECAECGFEDDIGNTLACPICNPDAICCPFLRRKHVCGIDLKGCPHVTKLNFEECPKLLC